MRGRLWGWLMAATAMLPGAAAAQDKAAWLADRMAQRQNPAPPRNSAPSQDRPSRGGGRADRDAGGGVGRPVDGGARFGGRGGEGRPDRQASPAQPVAQQAPQQGGGDRGQRWGGRDGAGQNRQGQRGDDRPDRSGVPSGGGRPNWAGAGQPGWRGQADQPGWRGRSDQSGSQGRSDQPGWQRPAQPSRPSAGWQRDRADGRDDARDGRRFDERAAWNRGWRSDDRYDWSGYRSGNGGAYRLPRYYAPYGWSYGYRRFSVGVTLTRVLFAQNYWIDDPWDYRLPPAYGPYRWVRYYNDALLVDVRYGQVVDMVHDIFW